MALVEGAAMRAGAAARQAIRDVEAEHSPRDGLAMAHCAAHPAGWQVDGYRPG